MNGNKTAKRLLLILMAITACVAVIYLLTRPQIPERTIRLAYNGKVVDMDISALPLETVKGSLVNGKGEVREIETEGCLLSAVLEKAFGSLAGVSKATVVAADEFSAEVTAEEWGQAGKVYLTFEDDAVQLVVFGDANSKRNVRDVERILVE